MKEVILNFINCLLKINAEGIDLNRNDYYYHKLAYFILILSSFNQKFYQVFYLKSYICHLSWFYLIRSNANLRRFVKKPIPVSIYQIFLHYVKFSPLYLSYFIKKQPILVINIQGFPLKFIRKLFNL